MQTVRAIIGLATSLLAAIQPAIAPCACVGCEADCAGNRPKPAHRSCCSLKESGWMACCGSRPGECPCGRTDSGNGHHGCACSAQPHASAIESHPVAIEQSPTVHCWLDADAFVTTGAAARPEIIGYAIDRGPPARFGGLRVHAYLGVWII